MDILRTPDGRFVDLPDYPFAPHYVEVDSGDGGHVSEFFCQLPCCHICHRFPIDLLEGIS